MKMASFEVQNLRSVCSATLDSIGGFNVLIGKNNSGKSTMLSAIDSFFRIVAAEGGIDLSPPTKKELDYHCKNRAAPIRLTAVFSLLEDERNEIVEQIVIEAPQMKHAVDALRTSDLLSVTISIRANPSLFAYVSDIALVTQAHGGNVEPPASRTLLHVGDIAAVDLFGKFSTYHGSSKSHHAILDFLDKLRRGSEREILTAAKTDPSSARGYRIQYLMDRMEIGDRALRSSIERLFQEAQSFEDFERSASSLADEFLHQAQTAVATPLEHPVRTFAGEQSSTPAYALTVLQRVAAIRVLHLKEHRKAIGKEEARRLLDLKVTRGGPEVLRNIQEIVEQLLGVKIDAFQSNSAPAKNSAELDVDNFLVEVNGSGIREALRLILDYEFEVPNILLVEEPEVHLHPGLETSMMRYLKRISADSQVFVTTHSTNFLDTAEMRNVYLVSKNGATVVELLDLQEAEARVPSELGLRLSSLFMFERLVFVEGPSDELVFREFASKLGLNLGSASVGFVHMGGVRNFAHFANEAVLSLLTKRRVQMWFVVDRDERDDADVRKLQERLGGKASLSVLNRRELENYLIQPRPLALFLTEKRRLAGFGDEEISDAQVDEAIRRCSDNLKHLAIKKRAIKRLLTPIYLDQAGALNAELADFVAAVDKEVGRSEAHLRSVRDSATAVIEAVSAEVEKLWASRPTHIVPGDILLDNIAQEFGVRFRKERDGGRLAALFDRSEIDTDLRTLLKSFTD